MTKSDWTLRCVRGTLYALLFAILSHVSAAPVTDPAPAKDEPGFFFPLEGAKDCAFDESRKRLYVTTGKKLVIIDLAKRTVIDQVDVQGDVQGCDVSHDSKYLALAPRTAQHFYWIDLDWKKVEDMDISQIRFKGDERESGVHSVCIGSDHSVLFSMTFAGSGGVKLRRFNPQTKKVEEAGRVNMDTVLAASGDRQFAAVAEGNISSGPLKVYDFKKQELRPVASLSCFHYEIGCGREARYFAQPHSKGCELYDEKGRKLGNLEGKPVIAAAFHPTADSLYVMRHGETNIQEYDVEGKNVSNAYPLDKPLVIKGEVRETVVGNLIPVGRDAVMANFKLVRNVNFKTYQSGRLKVANNGEKLFAVLPNGVYVFPLKPPSAKDKKDKPKIKVIDGD